MAKHHDRQRRKSIEATTPELIQKTLRSGAVRLDLCKLGLSTLPDTLGQLTQLEYLDLSLNELTALPESLGQLTWLLRLKLFHNQLSDLPESLGQLTRLEDLDLSDNQLRVLPESLTQINNLRTLDLSGNQLTRLPESLGQLGELRVLDLSVNRLTRLPESLQRLASLEVLDLNDNKALKLPKEVLGSTRQEERSYFDYRPASPAQILDYYFRIRSGSRPLNEAKLILLGRGLVGKTCIVNRLVHHIFNPNLKKTDGICITQWKRRFSATDEVRLNIWDFGGQEIMHSTHQFFLTQRSLYVLVLNGREGSEDTDVEYWLQLIGSFGGESPVIVVLNKIKEQPFDLNRRALQQKYPTIRAFLNTDCADETGLAELDAAIWRETNKLQGLRDSFPASWFAVKDQLADMKENYLSFDRYRHL